MLRKTGLFGFACVACLAVVLVPPVVGWTHRGGIAVQGCLDDPPDSRSKDRRPKKAKKKPKKKAKAKMPALRFKLKDIDGKERDLRRYHGHVVLIVNTASKCGLTPQYEGLQALYEKYKDDGFVILAFPANNFGRQEPGTNAQIKAFCTKQYDVTFPLFGKVSVKGTDMCRLYKYLTGKDVGHKFGGEIEWNFAKFLVGRKGKVLDRFHPRVRPTDEKLSKAIKKALAAPVPEGSPLARKRKAESQDE